jgi:hypothetical protein
MSVFPKLLDFHQPQERKAEVRVVADHRAVLRAASPPARAVLLADKSLPETRNQQLAAKSRADRSSGRPSCRVILP